MMEITWLGQGGFLVVSGKTRLAVDPYISDFAERTLQLTRLVPPPLTVEQLHPTAVFCTHDHIDHFDPEGIPCLAEAYPDVIVLGPTSVIHKCTEEHSKVRHCRQLDAGQSVNVGTLTLTATPATHGDPDAVGLIISDGQQRVYVSGDTEYTPELPEQIAATADSTLDAVFVCINGRMGNMDTQDAIRLVTALNPTAAYPMHYDLFAENTADPMPFVDAVRQAGIIADIMQPGTPFVLS